MAPKPKKGAPPAVEEVQEPAFQAPEGLPQVCPFQVELRAACVAVQLEAGLDELAIKKHLVAHHEFKCVHLELEAQAVEAAAESSTLKEELVKARAAAVADGYHVPAALARQLLDKRFAKDEAVAWQTEWARRHKLVQERKAAQAAAQAAVTTAQDERAAKQSALQTFDNKHARANADGEIEELAPSLRTTRTRLADDLAAANEALTAANTAAASATSALSDVEAAATEKWDQVQLYWLKGLPPSLQGVLDAVDAGVPLRAVLRLRNPTHPPAADAPAGAQLYEQLVAAHAAARTWDDPAAAIAAVDVTVGPQGGPFVPSGHYDGAGAAAVVGAVEAQAALRAVEACAGPYDKWAATRTVYTLAPAPAEAGLYHKLVQQAPAEQQSVAVMMHCMLEQVACNVEGHGEAAAEGSAVADAAARFDSVMQRTLGAVELRTAAGGDEYEYETVLHGDEAAMAARGLISGLVQPACKSGIEDKLNVSEVEERMAGVLASAHAAAAPTGEEVSHIRESLMRANANQEGLPWEQVERLSVLQAAQRLLPQSAQTQAELLSRNVLEELSPAHAAHAIAAASHAYPRTATHTLQPSGARVTVCCDADGPADGATAPGAALAACMSFSEYVETSLDTNGHVLPPSMPLCVYPVSRKALGQQAQIRTATVSEHVWLRASEHSFSAVSTDGSVATFAPGAVPQVAVHGAHGLHACFVRSVQPIAPERIGAEQSADKGAQAHDDAIRKPVTDSEAVAVSTCTPTGTSVYLDPVGTFIFRDSSSAGWRAVLHDGTWVVASADGKVCACMPDGSKVESRAGDGVAAQSAAAFAGWLATAADGRRSMLRNTDKASSQAAEQHDSDAVAAQTAQEQSTPASASPLNANEPAAGTGASGITSSSNGAEAALTPAEQAVAVDPDTGARVITRTDLSQRIEFTTGDVLELRPDGSRLTMTASGEWLLEAPDTPVVRGGGGRVACALQAGVLLEWHARDGKIVLQQDDGPTAVCRGSTVSCGFSAGDAEHVLAAAQSHDAAQLAADQSGCLVCDIGKNECGLQAVTTADGQAARLYGHKAGQLHGWEAAAAGTTSTTAGSKAANDTPPSLEQDHAAAGEANQTVDAGEAKSAAQGTHSNPSHLVPRVFVQEAGGRCVEFLRPHVYRTYTSRHAGRQGVVELQSAAGPLTVHRIIHHLAAVPPVPAPLPIAEGTSSQPPETIRAIRSLCVPQRLYPAVTAGLALPRIAAARPAAKHADATPPPPVLLMREFLVHEQLPAEALRAYERMVAATAQAMQTAASGDSAAENNLDSNGPSQSDRQGALLERLTALEAAARARALTLAAFTEAKASAEAAAREVAAQEAEAQAAADAANALKVYRAWDKRVGEFDACPQAPEPGKVLRYFDAEDGKRAAQRDPLLQGQMQVSRDTLPPRGDNSAASNAFATQGIYTAPRLHEDDQPHSDATQATRRSAPRSRQNSPNAARKGTSPSPTHAKRAARTFPDAAVDDELAGTSGLPQASASLNIDVLRREYETLKLTNTASAAQVRARGRDGTEFLLGCRSLDFGHVPRGTVVTRKLTLQNVALGAARFSVDQVQAPLSVAYPHGPVPVGLKAHVTVSFTSSDSVAVGEWRGEVVVRSAFNVLRCPVHGNVVEASQPAPSTQLSGGDDA